MQARSLLSELEMLQQINPSYMNTQEEINRLVQLRQLGELSEAKSKEMESRKKLRCASSGKSALALVGLGFTMVFTTLGLVDRDVISETPTGLTLELAGFALAFLGTAITQFEGVRRKLRCTSEADIRKDIDKSLLSDVLDAPHRENFLQKLRHFNIEVTEQTTVDGVEKLMQDEFTRLVGLRHYFSRLPSAPTLFRQNPANALAVANENNGQVRIDVQPEVTAPAI